MTCTTAARHALAIVFPDDPMNQQRWLLDALSECVKRRLSPAALQCVHDATDRPTLESCLRFLPDARPPEKLPLPSTATILDR